MPLISDYSDGTAIISFTLRNADGDVLASRNGGTVYYAASTIKLAVAMAVIEEIDAGHVYWDQMLAATHEFMSARGGFFSLADDEDEVDTEFPPDGSPMSVRDLVEIMIDRSSNEATDMLLGLIGIQRVQRLCAEFGMDRLHIERLIGDLAARDSGTPNEVTTDELSKLMLAAVRGDWTSAENRAFLRGALSRQRYDMIATELPSGTVWGSKSGSVEGIEHDVAYIGDPDSPDLLVLAVCTRGYEEQPAHEAIRAVAAAALASRLQ